MKKVRLPKEFRNKWLEALESGNYRQTHSSLIVQGRKNSYCCLGVACRLVKIPISKMSHIGMPAGLEDRIQEKLPKAIVNRRRNTQFARKLANLNDAGKTFSEIAKVIRKETIGV